MNPEAVTLWCKVCGVGLAWVGADLPPTCTESACQAVKPWVLTRSDITPRWTHNDKMLMAPLKIRLD